MNHPFEKLINIIFVPIFIVAKVVWHIVDAVFTFVADVLKNARSRMVVYLGKLLFSILILVLIGWVISK